MVQWDFLHNAEQGEWNQLLAGLNCTNYLQRYEWGGFKGSHGWVPCRCVYRDAEQKITALAQIFLKRLPMGITFIWCPGGIAAGNLSGAVWEQCISSFKDKLAQEYKRVFLRLYFADVGTDELTDFLGTQFLRPAPALKLKSDFSILIDIDRSNEELMKSLTKKHRYYVKKGLDNGIVWQASDALEDFKAFVDLLGEVGEVKNNSRLALPFKELEDLKKNFGSDLMLFKGVLDQEIMAACVVLKSGDEAFYLYAATGRKGREIFASYAMIVELWECLKSKGIKRFDFVGIDPLNPGAAGVDHYKKGFGGEVVEYAGEWEWASSGLLKKLGNLAVKWRIRKI